MECDVLVIGGGPSGVSAAIEAASYGLDTVLIDETFSIGGHLKSQTQFINDLPSEFEKMRGTTLAQKLDKRLFDSKTTVLLKHIFIGMYKDGRIGVSNGEYTFPIQAKKIIVATGFAEEAQAFPGWTKPGVMTIGAAQILMNHERVLPGENALILGSNDFSLEVAKQLKACGATILGIIESGEELMSKDESLIESVREQGIPIYLNCSIMEVRGAQEVEEALLEYEGKDVTLRTDLICIGRGITPVIEPFELLDCALTYNDILGGFLPRYSENWQTSHPSIYVAGKAAGISCVGVDLLSGELAAVCLAEALHAINGEDAERRKKMLWKELISLETNYSKKVSAARIASIRDFHKETNAELEILPDLIAGGI